MVYLNVFFRFGDVGGGGGLMVYFFFLNVNNYIYMIILVNFK